MTLLELLIRRIFMDKKDWFLLITPILCNGFFIFLFQTIVQSKIAETKRKKDQSRKIINEFIELLDDAKGHLALIELEIDVSEEPLFNFQECWAKACQYQVVHEYILDIFSDDVVKINRLNTEMTNILREFWEKVKNAPGVKHDEIEDFSRYGEYYTERRTQLLDELNKLCKKCL